MATTPLDNGPLKPRDFQVSPLIAFFVAPFFGLGWAMVRLVLHRSREIPYGPFLSMGTLAVMILHDPIVEYFLRAFEAK